MSRVTPDGLLRPDIFAAITCCFDRDEILEYEETVHKTRVRMTLKPGRGISGRSVRATGEILRAAGCPETSIHVETYVPEDSVLGCLVIEAWGVKYPGGPKGEW